MTALTSLTMRELKKLSNSPILIIMTVVQPILWLGLFGKAFDVTGFLTIPKDMLEGMPPFITAQFSRLVNEALQRLFGGTADYFSYLATGMLAIVVLFTSMQAGMSLIWDRRTGFLEKLLASPIHRRTILTSKVFYSVIRGLLQALLVFFIAVALGLDLSNAAPWSFALSFVSLFLLSLTLSSLFMLASVRVKTWETQMAMINLLNLPLMFASNTLAPASRLPEWILPVVQVNPVTYANNVIRASLFNQLIAYSDLLVLASYAIIMFTVCSLIGPKALEEV
jgi:ABC-2 type transport system permease protein